MSTLSPDTVIRTYETKGSKPSLLRFLTRNGSSHGGFAEPGTAASPLGQFRRMADVPETAADSAASSPRGGGSSSTLFSPITSTGHKTAATPPRASTLAKQSTSSPRETSTLSPSSASVLSPSQRLSTLMGSMRFRGSPRSRPGLTFDEAELEEVLMTTPEVKEELSTAFLADIGSDLATKLEFFTAAGETVREQDKKEKQRKTKMLIKLFFQSSMVQMSGIPSELVGEILQMNEDAIIQVQKIIAEDLLKHPKVIELMSLREVREEFV